MAGFRIFNDRFICFQRFLYCNFKGIVGKKETENFQNLQELVRKLVQELNQEFFVVFQQNNFELLEHVFQGFQLFDWWLVNHGVKRIENYGFWVQFLADNIIKNAEKTWRVDFFENSMIHHFVHFIELELSAQEIIFKVLPQIFVIEICFQVLFNDPINFL